jgi:Family of unknown function (DUF5681)
MYGLALASEAARRANGKRLLRDGRVARRSRVTHSTEENFMTETTAEAALPNHFKPGQSGNPKGKAKGTRNDNARKVAMAARLANKIGSKKLGAIVKVLTDAAEAGDVQAASLLLARCWPAPKTRLLHFELPPLETADDVKTAQVGFINGVAAGVLTVDEAERLSAMAERLGQAIAEVAFEKHLAAIQATLPRQIEGRAL